MCCLLHPWPSNNHLPRSLTQEPIMTKEENGKKSQRPNIHVTKTIISNLQATEQRKAQEFESLTGLTWPSKARILRPVLRSQTRARESSPQDAASDPSWWKSIP